MPRPISTYLAELQRALRGRPWLVRRVLTEAAAHLADAAAHGRREGLSELEAEQRAVRQFGPATLIARRYSTADSSVRWLLLAAASFTCLIATWLLWVSAVVLPARDPSHVLMWRLVAAAFLLYAGTSAVFATMDPWQGTLRWLVTVGSAGAVAVGVYAVVQTLSTAASPGHHFEGYLLIMGVVLTGHGLVALTYAVMTRRTRVARLT
jgi:hypothetical protein